MRGIATLVAAGIALAALGGCNEREGEDADTEENERENGDDDDD